MTLRELSQQYGGAACALWGRIKELEPMEREAEGESVSLVRARLRVLRAMYRETRQIEKHLANYYTHGGNSGWQ
jgi:hypothetical protein